MNSSLGKEDMLGSPCRIDQFGFLLETSNPTMVWHEPNPIPWVNRPRLSQPQPQNHPLPKTQHATKITGGNLKKTTQKAAETLQIGHAHTRENTFLALSTTSVMSAKSE